MCILATISIYNGNSFLFICSYICISWKKDHFKSVQVWGMYITYGKPYFGTTDWHAIFYFIFGVCLSSLIYLKWTCLKRGHLCERLGRWRLLMSPNVQRGSMRKEGKKSFGELENVEETQAVISAALCFVCHFLSSFLW